MTFTNNAFASLATLVLAALPLVVLAGSISPSL